MKMNWKDVIGALVIIGCFTAIMLGHDSYIFALLGTVTGYYFGRRETAK